MTRLYGLSIMTIGAALSMTAGLALAGETTVSADQILSALKPKPMTRGLSIGVHANPAATADAGSLVGDIAKSGLPGRLLWIVGWSLQDGGLACHGAPLVPTASLVHRRAS